MKRLVLVGAGHAHAQVLLEFARRKATDVEIVLVSPVARAPYSGMVPGWLAGLYQWDDCCIDFVRLCDRAGAVWRADSVIAIDATQSALTLASGERLQYHWLSLNIGSTLVPPPSELTTVLPMRPLAALHARWNALLATLAERKQAGCYRMLMVGGGAAGVESMLAAHRRLTQVAPDVCFEFTLATQGKDIVPGMAAGAARRLRSHLSRCGVVIVSNFCAERMEHDTVISRDGRALSADVMLWATGAQAHAWPRAGGLATDARHFVLVDATLRSVSHPNVFAAGDCASLQQQLPKAGVYAVRMGPVLAHNLYAAINGQPLHPYTAQRRHLVLVGTGDRHAVAAWGPFAWQGKWVWNWKQRIDRRFIARYSHA